MALVRCEQHGHPKGRSAEYIRSAEPIGYPDTAAICGLQGCDHPGLVWLTTDESQAYADEQRIFSLATNAAKIKVQ